MNPDKKLKTPEEEGRSPIWLTMYADIMTNLMLFFLVLYALTRMDAATRGSISQTMGEKFAGRAYKSSAESNRHKMMEEEFQQEAKKIQGLVETNEEKIKLSMPGEILFESASADLKGSAVQFLSDMANLLKKTSDKIIIEGNTDDVPIHTQKYESNWELSVARAESVLEYFASDGVPIGQLCISGYGEFKPLVPNTSPENRAKNRRIEISIMKKSNG